MPRRFLNLFPHVLIAVQVKHVRYKIESILIVLDISVKPCKVEPICEVVFIDLAKVLVASGRYELLVEDVNRL